MLLGTIAIVRVYCHNERSKEMLQKEKINSKISPFVRGDIEESSFFSPFVKGGIEDTLVFSPFVKGGRGIFSEHQYKPFIN